MHDFFGGRRYRARLVTSVRRTARLALSCVLVASVSGLTPAFGATAAAAPAPAVARRPATYLADARRPASAPATLPVTVGSVPAPSLAPVPAQFSAFQSAPERVGVTSTGATTGLVPSPVDYSHLRPSRLRSQVLAFPSRYDLRTLGRLTPVRNQGSYPICWTYGALGSLESNLMPAESHDFSEDHVALNTGFDGQDVYDGGNSEMAVAYLARWAGPLHEADEPLGSKTPVAGATVQKHVQDVTYLPKRTGPLDNDPIKAAVTADGAVNASMFWQDASYRSTTHAYCYGGSTSTNHAVLIVGWDDAYSRSNFVTPPAGDGAWIVRNSWGSKWGESGYFYISYYDGVFANKLNTVFNGTEPVSDYGRVYQYDPLGATGHLGLGTSTGWFRNRFTAQAADTVTAVSFYTAQTDATYTVYAGTGSTLRYAGSGTVPSAGYHTIRLETPLPVAAGQTFDVAVGLTTPGYTTPIPVELPRSGYSSAATATAGQGFISKDGKTWSDITARGGSYTNASVCLKAFTAAGPPGVAPKVTSAGFSNPIAYKIASLLSTRMVANISESNVHARLSIAMPDGSSWTVFDKDVANVGGQDYTFPDWDGKDPATGKQAPYAANYTWTLTVSKDGLSTTRTGGVLLSTVYFTRSGRSAGGASQTHTGYLSGSGASPQSVNVYVSAAAAAADSLAVRVTGPTGTAYSAAPENTPWAVGPSAPPPATARLTGASAISGNGVYTFAVTADNDASYTISVIE